LIVKPVQCRCRKPREYLIPKGTSLRRGRKATYVRKGDSLLDGALVPHDILNILGVEALAEYLIERNTGCLPPARALKINDKHIEVIVRQMMQKMEVSSMSATPRILVGEHMDREEFEEPSRQLYLEEGNDRSSWANRSFKGLRKPRSRRDPLSRRPLSRKRRASSPKLRRQRQSRIRLNGLKENVIVGRLIPAGTGAYVSQIKKLAASRDRIAIASQQQAAADMVADASSPANQEAEEAAA
jgi:DNA-directed RNA polymerase subunit beta'